MKPAICEQFGIDFPLFAFSHGRDVVAAVTNAGGFGVLGATAFTPDWLDKELSWIDDHVGGKPYGVDLIVPAKFEGKGENLSRGELASRIPDDYRGFIAELLAAHGIEPEESPRTGPSFLSGDTGKDLLEVAFSHPIKLIANALGSPPKDVIDQVHGAGVPVAALAGSAKHAQRHVDNGVDIVVAQGHEAGGHTGEIGSMVLWPEIVDALDGRAPVLAAGGIGTGRQVAAALALGASGVWMGSAFLTSAEYDLGHRTEAGTSVIQQALLGATSSDTVRRRIYTGKPARLLKSRWTDAWDAPDAPEPLPMPLQNILVSEAHQRMSESSDPTAVAMPVGQIVGRMNEIRPVADIIAELVSGFEDATNRLDDIRKG
jgi:NAD(P)H-dependent flavin oxidoreductase YrpB (nitropropane dioxygenase family)